MMTGRHDERLPEWLAAADLDDLPHLHSFTRGIRRDQATSGDGRWPLRKVSTRRRRQPDARAESAR